MTFKQTGKDAQASTNLAEFLLTDGKDINDMSEGLHPAHLIVNVFSK